MNDRILDIAIASRLISADYNGFDRTVMSGAERRFAEMLIQECANLAKAKSEQVIDRGMKYAVDIDEEDAVKSTAWQFDVFGQEIKNYFGIE